MSTQLGINFFLYASTLLTGFLGVTLEIRYKTRKLWLFILFLLFFYLSVLSRIGHAYFYSDFQHYIDYFETETDAYFEAGYVIITSSIRKYLGNSPVYLVSTIFTLTVSMICFAAWQFHRQICLSQGNSTKSFSYLFTFLSIWSVYYGFTSCAEGMRPGLSIAILYSCMIFALNKRWYFALFFLLLATFFHTQAIIFLPGLIFLFFVDTVSIRKLRFWFALNLILGLFIGLFRIFDFSILELLFNTMNRYGDASHYSDYLSANETNFISTQWLTKQIVAFLLLFGNHSNRLYNRATILYYLGMSIAAVMSASSIFLRFEGIYIPSFLLAFYLFLGDNNYSKSRRLLLFTIFLFYYGTMLLRYLGLYY